MFFRPILNPNGEAQLSADLARLASELGVPVKNVRQWWYNDSIPGGWYQRVAATGAATLERIAAAGTARDIAARSPANSAASQGAAA